MKNCLMIVLFSLGVSTLSQADICPYVSQFTPELPPAGWSLLVPAVFPGDHYRFVSATHSLNASYYNLQVLCRYECAPNATACSPFTLLSNATYKSPAKNKGMWNTQPFYVQTLVCMPPDNNPVRCVFSNVPNDTLALVKPKWKNYRKQAFTATHMLI